MWKFGLGPQTCGCSFEGTKVHQKEAVSLLPGGGGVPTKNTPMHFGVPVGSSLHQPSVDPVLPEASPPPIGSDTNANCRNSRSEEALVQGGMVSKSGDVSWKRLVSLIFFVSFGWGSRASLDKG